MKVLSLASAAALFAFGAVAAHAQDGTCTNPYPAASNSTYANIDLCAHANTLTALGTAGGPQRDAVYLFTAQDADATLTLTHDAAFTGVFYLVPVVGGNTCATSVDPIQFGFQGAPYTITPGDGVTNSNDYLIVVTADPGGPENACGTFTLEVQNTLPVELQSFSVD